MITYANHKDPSRVMRLAVFDDIAPLAKGTRFEYWQGSSDWDPKGLRADVFATARELADKGWIMLGQKCIGEGVYSYRAVVL